MEKIRTEVGNPEAWICVGYNIPCDGGFYPCEPGGAMMEPTLGSGWDGLYVCFDCGRIFDQDDLIVIRKASASVIKANLTFK